MPCESGGGDVTNSFALVAYIPDPLRKFLDDLRQELVPGCLPRAHVTILPPRPLSGPPSAAIEMVRARIPDFSSFEVELGEVAVFDASDVVYIEIKEGRDELLQMHRALNTGPLKFDAQYPYHPHITLAQDLTHEQAAELAEIARRRWSEYRYSRVFPVESLVFVQNTSRNRWTDLAYFQLDPAPSIRR
jgi:2'-5' RNA ligase